MGPSQNPAMKIYTKLNENHGCTGIQHAVYPPTRNTSDSAYAAIISSALQVVKGSTTSSSSALMSVHSLKHFSAAPSHVWQPHISPVLLL